MTRYPSRGSLEAGAKKAALQSFMRRLGIMEAETLADSFLKLILI
jgi:hypothetical protein